MTADAAPLEARDGQVRSPFTEILETLVFSCEGALAAGLVDHEGEQVDMAASDLAGQAGMAAGLPAYLIKLSGAHWQIVMRDAIATETLGGVRQMWVWADNYAYLSVCLTDGYVLTMVCKPQALAKMSRRALRQAEVELCLEAGWDVPDPHQTCWRRAAVQLAQDGRPASVLLAGIWQRELESLGPVEGLGSFERGFRVLTPQGRELALVREPTGYWYAGSPLGDLYM